MAISEGMLGTRSQRHTLRLVQPGPQLRLCLAVIAVTLGFGVLFAANSYAAFGELYQAALSAAPKIFEGDIGAQALSYLYVSLAILAGYVLTVLGVCVAMLHRMLGPTVALERHVRSLKLGEYSARLSLRSEDSAYSELARHLNELAERLEQHQRGRAS